MKHIKKNPGGENSETSASVTYVSLTKIRSKSWQTSSMLTFFVLLVLLSWLLGQGIQQLNKKTVYSKLFVTVLILPSHCLSDRAVQNSTDSHCLRERYTYTACSSESPGRNSIYTGSDSDLLKVQTPFSSHCSAQAPSFQDSSTVPVKPFSGCEQSLHKEKLYRKRKSTVMHWLNQK